MAATATSPLTLLRVPRPTMPPRSVPPTLTAGLLAAVPLPALMTVFWPVVVPSTLIESPPLPPLMVAPAAVSAFRKAKLPILPEFKVTAPVLENVMLEGAAPREDVGRRRRRPRQRGADGVEAACRGREIVDHERIRRCRCRR